MNEYQEQKAVKASRFMILFSKVNENVSQVVNSVKNKVPIDKIGSIVSDPLSRCDGDEFWLYLIDEYTMQPVIPLSSSNSPYPLRIKTPNELYPNIYLL